MKDEYVITRTENEYASLLLINARKLVDNFIAALYQ